MHMCFYVDSSEFEPEFGVYFVIRADGTEFIRSWVRAKSVARVKQELIADGYRELSEDEVKNLV